MTEVLSQVSFDVLSTDGAVDLDRLTTDLETELVEIGEVTRAAEGSMPATLNVLTGIEPAQIEAMVRAVTGFAGRHKDRCVYVQIGGYEIKLDHASAEQVDDLIATFQAAVKR